MFRSLSPKKPLQVLLKEAEGENRLRRILGPVGLTSLGIGAIMGTGIFVLTGIAAHDKAGPALTLSFIIAGFACVFAALCYAEFASMAPVAGSAYTYAYVTIGEFFAWVIGWDLVLEYSVAAAAVAHGWSHYFQDFIGIFGFQVPNLFAFAPFDYDPQTAHFLPTGSIFDLPAIVIVAVLSGILVKGIKESVKFNAWMVGIKLAVVFFVIAVGAFYIDPANWVPFAPFGYGGFSLFGKFHFGTVAPDGTVVGVLAGASMIFFAYIGFDSVSTHAEEAKNPHRDVPLGIIMSLFVCTILYIGVSTVLTGMVPYNELDINAPVSNAFARVGLPWAQFLVSIGALAGITSVLLVLLLSLPRVLLAMARDNLIPPGFFAAVHPRFRTPWKATIINGIFVGLLAALLPLRVLAELVNIGTLLAFVVVCTAVLVMRYTDPDAPRAFRAPFVPMVPVLGVVLCLLLMFSLPVENWWRLVVWLIIGFVIYFGYGRKHSLLRVKQEPTAGAPTTEIKPL